MHPFIPCPPRRLVAFAATASLLVSCADLRGDSPPASQAEEGLATAEELPTLDDVLARLREHETPWLNAEFFVRHKYELISDDRWEGLTLVREGTSRCVYQGQHSYVESATLSKGVDGRSSSWVGASASDGRQTLTWSAGSQGIDAAILDWRHPKQLLLPHVLLIHHEFTPGRLSEFLTKPSREGARFETLVVGHESLGGRKCIRVRKQSWDAQGGPQLTSWDLWLAIDRSYLPARLELSENGRLVSEAVVKEFAQADAGVWYPRSASAIGFDGAIPARSNKYALGNVRLNPEFVPDVAFPAGTRVRVVRDGKTVQEFIQPPQEREEE